MKKKIKRIHNKIKDKGWTNHEINKTLIILSYGKSNQKNLFNRRINEDVIYWVSLLTAIIGNLFISFLLVPFLIVTKHSLIYPIIILFGLGYGYIFSYLLEDVELNFPKHHIISLIVIPVVAIINLTYIVNITNDLLRLLNMETYNPYIVSSIYMISFFIPVVYTETPNVMDSLLSKAYKTK